MSSRQNLEITPANHTSTGNISYKSGNPVIQFIIGEQDRMLVGNSLRFVGEFQTFFNANQDIPGNASTLRMDEVLGVYSIIDQLTIKSQSTHQVIEEIKHYPRFLASYLPTTMTLNDNAGHIGQQACTLPTYEGQKLSTVCIPSMKNSANHFAITLPCGLFNGQNPIPLASNANGGLGGLLVEITLAPDSNVFFESGGTAATISDSFYQLKNVKLVAEAITPDPRQGFPKMNSFEYNSISSYFTTFNSTNAIVNFQLGLSRVLGVFGNMITASKINNRGENGLTCNYPVNSGGSESAAPINQLLFTRAGERFPLEYNIDTLQKDDATDLKADPQVVRNYMNAIRKFSALNRTMVSPLNTEYSAGTPTVVNTKIEGGSNAGIGVAYDVISGSGVDFSNVNWGLNMDCQLVTDNPQALYLFVHSKQTVVFSQNGIQVVR
jgi:hypothetical protein